MYFASKNSKKQIVHYDYCSYRKCMRKGNIITFTTLEEARAVGYRLCDCCAPIRKYVRAEAEEISSFSQEHGVTCHQHDGVLCVRTPYSRWKIIVNGQKHNIFLYHFVAETGWKILDLFVTGDVREGRGEEQWMNGVVKRMLFE